MLVKNLGGIDLASALAFLLLVFGIDVFTQYIFFCVGLLPIKGLFAFKGDVLSLVDLFVAAILLLSLILAFLFFCFGLQLFCS